MLTNTVDWDNGRETLVNGPASAIAIKVIGAA